MTDFAEGQKVKKRKSGIPSGNAGEYLVTGELLRRGFDAQLADRNTKGYDLLAGRANRRMRRIQVKTVRTAPWYISRSSFVGDLLNQVTIYVLLGPEERQNPPRYFIAKNIDVAAHAHYPQGWEKNGFLNLKAVEHYEDAWSTLDE
jgi:hypothetical protein